MTSSNHALNNEWSAATSPFFSCSGPRNNLAGQKRRSWHHLQIPLKDRGGNLTLDFLKELQKKIEEKAQKNLDLSRSIGTCLKPPYLATNTQECFELRSWVDPEKYPLQNPLDRESTLIYNIKKARAHLALASNSSSSVNILKPNKELTTYGYKSIPWEALSPEERLSATNNLLKYKAQFIENNKITETEFNSLLKPYDYSTAGQIYPNPMNASTEEMRHRVLTSELERKISKVRNQHLDEYRYIVSQFPIINYLSTANPSLLELQTASKRMSTNAQKELDNVKSIGRALNSSQKILNPRVQSESGNISQATDLMDYTNIVEDLLAEKPEFCAVATTTELQRQKRELISSVLVGAPLMAACFIAPPSAAVALSITASAGYAYSSYHNYKWQQQSAYSSPINDGLLRSNQFDVDVAGDTFRSDLMMLPIDGILGGGISYGAEIIRRIGK